MAPQHREGKRIRRKKMEQTEKELRSEIARLKNELNELKRKFHPRGEKFDAIRKQRRKINKVIKNNIKKVKGQNKADDGRLICWEWKQPHDSKSHIHIPAYKPKYPYKITTSTTTHNKGKSSYSDRPRIVAYELKTKKPFNTKEWGLYPIKCGNPKCINPAHMVKESIDQRNERGAARGALYKYSDEDKKKAVAEILNLREKGDAYKDIIEALHRMGYDKVTEATVKGILSGKTYRSFR